MNLDGMLKQNFAASTHVAEITKPLESLSVIGFFHVRIYPDGSFINLASRPDWSEFYFKQLFQGHYHSKDTSDQLYSHDGVSLWSLNPDNKVWQDGAKHFGYGNGVSIFEEDKLAREITCFYSTADNHAINHFYINNVDTLKKFKRHFISEAADLIQHGEKNKFILPQAILHNENIERPCIPQDKLLQQLGISESGFSTLDWNSIFQLSLWQLDDLLIKPRYPIQLDIGQITLSRMEIKTLIQLLKGQHATEIAISLQIKKSTVESYLANIKNKLCVRLKSELVHRVINSHLLQQIA